MILCYVSSSCIILILQLYTQLFSSLSFVFSINTFREVERHSANDKNNLLKNLYVIGNVLLQ